MLDREWTIEQLQFYQFRTSASRLPSPSSRSAAPSSEATRHSSASPLNSLKNARSPRNGTPRGSNAAPASFVLDAVPMTQDEEFMDALQYGVASAQVCAFFITEFQHISTEMLQ